MRVKANLYFVFTRKVKETQIPGKHKFVARGKNDTIVRVRMRMREIK